MNELVFKHVMDGNVVYRDCLQAILGDMPRDSMIDLGCNLAPHTAVLGFKERKYVDILPRTLDHTEEQQYFEQADILDTPLDVHYDVAFSLDCIEHLTISGGYKLMHIMNSISDKQVIFTPLTDLFGFAEPNNYDPEAHRSLWQPSMFEGYAALTFPNFHSIWNGGAFFVWKCEDIDSDFRRVHNQLTQLKWYNGKH
jgi:hypothetical protein